MTSATELKSDCCSKPKRRIKTPPRILFEKRFKKIHIKESNPETVAETKKNNKYFESKSKSYTLKYLNGHSRELLAMPSMKITYEDNLAAKSYLCAEYQKINSYNFLWYSEYNWRIISDEKPRESIKR